MSGRQLAVQAGITPSMLSQIERSGKAASARTLKVIARILDVPLEAICRTFPPEPRTCWRIPAGRSPGF
ncbi:XRE family transcriptional regulator [Mesorhizobium sp. M1D.F.Ca.ET.184.01.1.1]|nr:XRE family transcriptional regulator [Mesorhizobium sp. M1D.F.Ca.ET.231.01.1.1]TGP36643.1 XRE family transcriptional regulator [Mesorhizobium sp. M1D.F.Ca.ET.234.01.1.1]TGS50144.1 XRE family transcriptional regulator [Mesorhizobium sp. M1D.F.Ca.ET.184.01.1.1]TGS64855.1 XRE family transcriptional regulator [Mesorhizobium sp. M1D.F.Ca.ET.183.01.1.1]